MIYVSVSFASNFVQSPTAADHGYHFFCELARFIYCLLQIRKGSSLPLVPQWEEYLTPNPSRLPPIDEEDFLSATRVMTALNKVGSHYLKTELRRDACRFPEEVVICMLSTVASRSPTEQGIGCFWPSIVIGGDDIAPFQLLNKILVGHLEQGWTKRGEIEAWRAKYQSFVQEQRQLEWSCIVSRPDLGHILSYCSAQAGFCSRQHL